MEEQGVEAKSRKRFAGKIRAFLLISAILFSFVIVLIVCLKQNEEINQFVVKDVSLYTWFGTEEIFYDNSTLVFDRFGSATELKIGNNNHYEEVDSVPYFYTNERKVLFPNIMSLVRPRSYVDQQVRLPSLTILDGTYADPMVTFADFSQTLGDAFLFDGDDLYFFVNAVSLYVDGELIELPGLSFVIYNYNHELYVYDYSSDEAKYYEYVEFLRAETQDYTINLVTDTFETGGKSWLLVKNVEALKVLD